MYESFYHLRTRPFSLLPDPEFLFLSRRHKSGLNVLEYGLLNRAVFTVLTGEAGTGKTTLLNKILDQSRGRYTVGVIATTHPSAASLLPWVADAFGLDCAGQDTVGHFRTITAFLKRSFTADQQVLLVVDEAQNLNVHMLEDLRLLSNINDGRQSGIQIILAGQPSLRALLSRSDMRQLAQRITVDYALEPLNEEDTRAYVNHRLRVAGSTADLFTAYACSILHQLTGGTPRMINQLCDLALAYGYGEGAQRITAAQVLQVAVDRSHGGILQTAVEPKPLILSPEHLERESGELSSEPSLPQSPVPPQSPIPSSTTPTPAHPSNLTEIYQQGLKMKQAGLYRDAMEKFETAGRDPAFSFRAMAQRGMCLRAIGRLEDAVDSFHHALAVNGAKAIDLMNVRYVLARTLDTMGHSDQAHEQYRKIHELDPFFRDIAVRVESLDHSSLFSSRGGFPPITWLRSLKKSWLETKEPSVQGGRLSERRPSRFRRPNL